MVRLRMIQSVVLFLLAAIAFSLPVIGVRARHLEAEIDTSAVEDYLRAEMQELRIPGLEVVIVSGDQVVYSQGFGVADRSGRAVTPQTPMLLGSVSKGFTALAVMQLVESGEIDRDAPVQHYLPWLRQTGRSRSTQVDPWAQITVRHLLHHTSGIPEYAGANTWDSRYVGDDALEEQVRSFADLTLVHTPGETFEYSNANYEILGLIVQVVSGQSYESYVREHIFRPLDMRHTYALAADAAGIATGYRYWFGRPVAAPNLPIPRAHAPSAMLVSTAEDMGHYLIAHMNGGRYGDTQILSAQGMAELHRPAVPAWEGQYYAMGWAVEADGSLSHNGETASFTSGIRIEGQQGVFVARNIAANQREQRLNEIAPGVLQVARGRAPVQNPVDPYFRRTMVELAALLAIQLAGTAWFVRRLRRWIRRSPRVHRSAARMLLAVLPWLAIDLALVALLWYMGPISGHRTFRVQALSAPDQMLLLGANVILALVGASVQAASAIAWWRNRPAPAEADALSSVS